MKGERDSLPFRIEDMQLDDIDEVMSIEHRSFFVALVSAGLSL